MSRATRFAARLLAVVLLTGGLLAGAGSPATAAPVLGGQLFATGGNIEVEVLFESAGFTSELYLFSPESTPRYIATNRDAGMVVQLGSYPQGVELVFGIVVQQTGHTFVLGDGSRNPDGIVHAGVDFLAPGIADVGFEDIFAGGDEDYNDVRFQFRGGIASEPETGPPYTGRATVAQAGEFVTGTTATVVDTGQVASRQPAVDQDVAAEAANTTLGLTASALGSRVEVLSREPAVRSETHAVRASVLSGLVEAEGIYASSFTSCGSRSSDGFTRIGKLSVGGNTIVDETPAPNTAFTLGGATIVLNEQTSSGGEGALGLKVVAVRVIVPGVADVALGVAETGVTGC